MKNTFKIEDHTYEEASGEKERVALGGKKLKHTRRGVQQIRKDHSHGPSCGCGGDHSHEATCGCGEDHSHEEEACGCAICDLEVGLKGTPKKAKVEKSDMQIWARLGISILLLLVGIGIKLDIVIGISYVIIGYDVLLKAVKNISKGKLFDEHFLMAIATIAAIVIGEIPEAVAVMLFYQVGEYFQGKAVAKSRNAIASLMDIKPEMARVYRGSEWIEVQPEVVRKGERLQVRPGEKIPLDGIIVKGKTTVDTSMLTGESMPAFIEEGMQVLSGSINKESMVEVEVTHLLADSTVSKILEMIEHASSRKTTAEQFITRFAKWYTPAVVVLALMVAVIPSLVTGDWHEWIYRSIVFLMISCPCALVVSVPLSFFGGIGAASKQGILVKGSNYLEALSTIDTVVLDKTGTITKGSFEVVEVLPAQGVEQKELLSIARQVEAHSNHPIARAIVSYVEEDWEGVITSYSEEAGYGITALLEGKEVLAGNGKLMEKQGVSYEAVDKIGTWVYIAFDGKYLGAIGVSDVVKADTKEALKQLKAYGIKRIVMLTGDKKEIAEVIGKEVGVDTVYAELLPQHKVEKVEAFIVEGSKVAFAGDGINDAPALTLAHVGIAMGGIGSDAAVEASDMVIMTDSLLKIAEGIAIAKETKRIVTQNIILALGVKALVMLLGVIGIANIWLAVLADVGVAILAILNAIRILLRKTKH
ncbi:MAG: heavy metal translocating P-type ATPase [Cellulosilyticaceae bacterium]